MAAGPRARAWLATGSFTTFGSSRVAWRAVTVSTDSTSTTFNSITTFNISLFPLFVSLLLFLLPPLLHGFLQSKIWQCLECGPTLISFFFLYYLQLCQFFSYLDKAKVQFASKMICQSTVIVMDAKVCRAYFTHSKLLLLIAGGRHGIAVFLLSSKFFLAKIFNLLHQLHAFLNKPLSAHLLSLRQLLADLLCQLMDL